MIYTLPIILLEILILTLLSMFDPAFKYSYVNIDGNSSYEMRSCKTETRAYFITQNLFHGSLLIAGCISAFMTRNIGSAFGEANQLLFVIYNFVLLSLMVLLMEIYLDIDRTSLYVI